MSFSLRLKTNVIKNLVSLCCGLAMVLAYAPFAFWFIPFIALPIWLATLQHSTSMQAAQRGFYFGIGWFIAGVGWVNVSIEEFGGLPFGISYLLTVILALYLALFPALATYLTAKFSRDKQLNLWLVPSLWFLSEFLRAHLLTGFPWLSLGYSQIDSPLRSLAPIIGETGLAFLLILTAVVIVNGWSKQAYKTTSVYVLILIALTFVSSRLTFVSPEKPAANVALIQGNIAQSMRWSPEEAWPTMFKYQDITRENYDADLIIWPEAAIPALEPVAQEFLALVNRGAAHNNSAIISGIIDYNFESKKYFNSLIVLGKKNTDSVQGDYYYHNNNQYYKHHLLPIGEFVPLEDWLRPIAPLFNLPMSSFSRGDYVQPNLRANGFNILPLICFEIAFPQQLTANLTNDTDFILTVSNDAWFGRSHGPHQHLEIARMRALEFARPVLRATNNGITAVIDTKGNIVQRIPQFEQQVLKTQVQAVRGLTPYARFGNWPLWIVAMLALAVLLIVQQRQVDKTSAIKTTV